MTDRRGTRALWQGPVVVWVALLVLFAMSFGSAYLPLGAANVAVNLLMAGAMIVVLATFLMDLRRADRIIHIVAAGGLFWLVLMFALTFSDYLSRHY